MAAAANARHHVSQHVKLHAQLQIRSAKETKKKSCCRMIVTAFYFIGEYIF